MGAGAVAVKRCVHTVATSGSGWTECSAVERRSTDIRLTGIDSARINAMGNDPAIRRRPDLPRETKTLLWVVGAIALIVVIGTVGYMLIERWGFLDALYMTVTTITTVGFKEVQPLSTGGRIFSMLLILGGVGVILYGLGTIVEYAIKAQLSGVFKRRVVKRQVERLQNHYIICGYGRVGEAVARQFAAQRADFVVVDNDAEGLQRAENDGYLVVEGDATSDEALRPRVSRRARGVVAAVGSDAGNIYVTLVGESVEPRVADRGSGQL